MYVCTCCIYTYTHTRVYIGAEDNMERESELEHRPDHHSRSSIPTAAATRASDINVSGGLANRGASVPESELYIHVIQIIHTFAATL